MSPNGWTSACELCGAAYDATYADYCGTCGGPVVLRATTRSLAARRATPLGGPAAGIWRYADHLPLDMARSGISLGEGGTPLIAAPSLADRVGAGEVWLKLDQLNPTGSFKDRAVAASVAHAVADEAPGVVCASSGNAAASAAAYAARAGLPAVLVVPEATPLGKLECAAVHGASVLAVPGDYSRSFALARRLSTELGLANVATTYVNPHGSAALRTVAFELAERLERAPDWVHVPTGSGPLVHGVVAGFEDLTRLGLVSAVPRTVAAQPAGCSPIAAAFAGGADSVEAWPEVTTRVSGINDPLRGYAGDGTQTLREVRTSRGQAIGLRDEEIFDAGRMLAAEHGLFVEPAAAASVASLLNLAGEYRRTDVVVALLTGHGLKTLSGREGVARNVSSVEEAKAALVDAGIRVDAKG